MSTPAERSEPLPSPNPPIGVIIIASVRLYREGLAAVLAGHSRLAVLGTAATLDDALGLVAATPPDILAIDVTCRDRLDVIRRLRDACPGARLVAFAIEELDDEVLFCAQAGIAGYVPHDASAADLVAVIVGVMRDEFSCSPRTAALLFRRLSAVATGETGPPVRSLLTRRETQIATLIDEGLSNKEIAQRLVVEVATVKNHVHNILDKLDVSSRAEAAALVRRALPRLSRRPFTPAV